MASTALSRISENGLSGLIVSADDKLPEFADENLPVPVQE
jgi:hypothetical protein